jgi:hypothetical protein
LKGSTAVKYFEILHSKIAVKVQYSDISHIKEAVSQNLNRVIVPD